MRLLYLEGDRCSLKYLLGAFRASGIDVENPANAPSTWTGLDAVLLSDYTADALGAAAARALAAEVDRGLGLLMVGGWTSFGRGGYARSPLAEALPVQLVDGDDRRALVRGEHPVKIAEHAALAGLDWTRAPVICGLNRLRAKPA
ncbi:MAG: glutamine amidotransferase, partial [Thermoplasmatota archaeon]